jgi:hypothetical protein
MFKDRVIGGWSDLRKSIKSFSEISETPKSGGGYFTNTKGKSSSAIA